MGMASSQARLLHITARMHQIEYKAQRLEAQKLQLANESDRVYEEYLNAIDAVKIQYRGIAQDGTTTFNDATYQSLIDNGYQIFFKDFGYGLPHEDYEFFVEATENKTSFADNNKEYFAALKTGRVTTSSTEVDGYTEVYTATQLENILNTDQSNKKYRLMSNINLSGKSFSSHNISDTEIDGNGYSITGISKSLFNEIKGSSTVKNLNISGNISGNGLLAKKVSTTGSISNVKATGTVNANSDGAGGLIGTITQGTVEYCSTNVTVKGTGNSVGGLIGKSGDENSGHTVVIHDCSTSGSVTSNHYVGGFIGTITHTTITNSTSSASSTATMLNTNDSLGYESTAGGFIGLISNGGVTVSNCSASGDVTTAASKVGGFVAHMWNSADSKISNCSSSGKVTYNTAAETTGGQDKLNYFRNEIINYTLCAGGFIGHLQSGTIENCYTSSSIDSSYDDYLDPTNPVEKGQAGTFCGHITANYGDSNLSGNYSTNQTDAFCGNIGGNDPLSGGIVNAQISSVPSQNITTITPSSAPAFTQVKVNNAGADAARALFDEAAAKGEVYDLSDANPYGLNDHKNDSKWLTNLITEGYIFLSKYNSGSGEYIDVNVATDTGLREISDETDLKKAEAKYEADMRQIDKKDRKYDTDLAALETERMACKQEIDTLKTVAKDNVDRTFKLFS